MDKDKEPTSRRKKVLKKVDASTSPSVDQIKKLLKEALLENIEDNKNRSNRDIDALVATMEEFLRSFILVGYNLKNEPIIITHARTQLDADALHSSFTRLFLSISNNGGF
jgi:hypothetical protein